MKKQLLILLITLFVLQSLKAQVPCWYDSLRIKTHLQDSNAKQNEDLFYYKLNKWREKNSLNLNPTPMPEPCDNCLQIAPSCFKAKFIIPVMVHVIHLPTHGTVGFNSNISNDQINSQMQSLNQYFANYNNPNPKSVNTGIQFCLKGINRISNNLSNHNPDDMTQLMNLKSSSFEYKDYLHIYIVNEIVDGNGASSGIQGYATFPGANPQGVVMRYKRFGIANGTNNVDANSGANVLVHEIGHFLGLKHPFEGGCVGMNSTTCKSEGDKCCDVPPVATANYGCTYSFINSCVEDNDQPDMINNFMDYTNDACRTMFTQNQAEIMHFTLSTVRSELVNIKHINALNLNCCSFSARFSANNNVLCNRDSVYFTALQYTSGSPTYIWTIKNSSGTVVHTASSTHYQYSWYLPSRANKYTIQLKVVLDTDTATEEIQDIVQLIDCGAPIKSSQGTWYFGQYAGLRFMQNAVIMEDKAFKGNPLPTINTGEGIISVCDSLGNLLFYGGGKEWDMNVAKIFNQNHERAETKDTTNIVDIFGSGTSTQGILSFPNPNNTGQYLIFTNQSNLSSGNLYVSVFDTSEGNHGKLLKNNFTKGIKTFNGFEKVSYTTNTNRKDTTFRVFEQITAVPQCNGKDYWLITITDSIKYSNTVFLSSYSVKSESNIIPTNKIKLNNLNSTQGYIKVSPDGNFVAYNRYIFKFNTTDGSFTLWDSIILQNNARDVYGVSFSPNSKVFYYIEQTTTGYDEYIWQLDLTIPQPFANRKRVAKALIGYFSAMQLGPDGKIYISIDNNPYISVINKPNEINFTNNNNACDFEEEGVYTQIGGIGGISSVGLPNMVDAVKPNSIIKDIFITQYNCDSIKVSSNVCCATTYVWDFGDGSSLKYGKEVHHRFSANGTYNVSLSVDGLLAKTIQVKVGMPQHQIKGLLSVCNNSSANLYTTDLPINGYYEYNWSSSQATITSNNIYPNQVYAKWNSSGTLNLTIYDIKTGCKDTTLLTVERRLSIGNNVISSNNLSQMHCKKNKIDTIKGTEPTNVRLNFSYGWLFKKQGSNNYEMLFTEKGKDIIPNPLISGSYKRFVYDSGCYHESNIINVCMAKNTIKEVKSGFCKQLSVGSNTCNNNYDIYKWQISNDSINWQNIPNSNTKDYWIERTETKKWYRRISDLFACGTDTSFSNIISYDPNLFKPYKDLDDVYTCSYGGAIYLPMVFNALSEHEPNSSKDYYRIKHGTNVAYKISTIDSITYNYGYNDLDTVFCIQSIVGCGTFKSRKAVIYKANGVPTVSTHPSNLTLSSNEIGSMTVEVSNPTGCKYQWQYSPDGSTWYDDIKNANEQTKVFINNQSCALDLYYRAKITNGCGSSYSNSARLIFYVTIPPTFDYWMKNSVVDVGNEPDTNTKNYMLSQDIWIRHLKDDVIQHQDLDTKKDSCFVYVTVRNRGKNPTQSAKLYTYWTWGATQETWTKNWTYNNNNRFLNAGQYYPMGGEINKIGIDIPEIPENQSVTIAIPWKDFPKKGWYNMQDQKWNTDRINICLLARIQTCDVPYYGMSAIETSNILYNIKHNNNIISRNTYTIPLAPLPPPNSDGFNNNDHERIAINPNIINGGLIVVRNNEDEQKTSSVCIKTTNTAYFDKAETFIEIGDALKSAFAWSPSLVYNGMTHVSGNIYQITFSNACFDNVVLPAHFQDVVEPLFAYKDINNRFADGLSFNTLIQQKDSLGELLGECLFTLTDNLFVNPEPTYIEKDSSFYLCNNGVSPTSVAYTVDTEFTYTLYDEDAEPVSPSSGNTFDLSEGNYTLIAIDSNQFKHYITNIHVVMNEEETLNLVDEIQIDCEALPYQFNSNFDEVLVFENNAPMDSSTYNLYVMNPTNNAYRTEYRNLGTCQYENRLLNFTDILMSPPTDPSAYVFAKYDRTEDSCAFVRLSDLSCNSTPLTFGKTIDIYNMDLQYLYTATIEQYGSSTIGFRFCPPNWNTHEDHIHDWHQMIYKANLCEYCRIDFKADSMIVFDRTSSIQSANHLEVKMYPNPTSKVVNIQVNTNNQQPISIMIYDQLGKLVMKQTVNTEPNGMHSLSLEGLSQGVYHVMIPELGFAKQLVLIFDR